MIDNVFITGATAPAADVLAAARSCLGAPFRYQGRNPTTGLDCLGVVALTAIRSGLMTGDYTSYKMIPTGTHAKDVADATLNKVWENPNWPADRATSCNVPPEELKPGRIAVFWYVSHAEPQHFAVIGQHPLDPATPTMIHAHGTLNNCVETSLPWFWSRRLVALYTIPGTIE